MADSKLVDLTAEAAPTGDDLIYVVNDPSGTPADRKVTLTNLAGSAPFTGAFVGQDGAATLSSRSTAPTDPQEGDLWYDADDTLPAVTAAQVTFDATGLTEVSGSDVQAALESVDTAIAGLTAVGSASVAYKTADESVSNTTLQDDNHLLFAIGANQVWSVVWHLYVTNAAATADIKCIPSAPSGATIRYGIHGAASGIVSTEGDGHFQSHSSGAIQAGVPASANADTYVIFSATVENGATPGNVVLQWAQQNTDGSNATTVKRGSFMTAHRMA